jgi:hypothetical protein
MGSPGAIGLGGAMGSGTGFGPGPRGSSSAGGGGKTSIGRGGEYFVGGSSLTIGRSIGQATDRTLLMTWGAPAVCTGWPAEMTTRKVPPRDTPWRTSW